jgi:SAM-dependent methyltransferase
MLRKLIGAAGRAIPAPVRHPLRRLIWGRDGYLPVGSVDFGSLRRVSPIDRHFGYSRGTPVDRYYIERYMAAHASDVRGRVLEVGDDAYTRRFGADRVAVRDVLNPVAGVPGTTIVGNLATGAGLPDQTFDCVICTQVLLLLYDVRGAARTLHRILRPGGVALVTVPGICHIPREDMDRWGDFWRFTSLGARRTFEEAFGAEHVGVETYGNVLSAASLLYGIATEELHPTELDHRDPDYEVTIGVRAERRAR